ncbi:MAG TPA: DUF1285 domain-containing protein [Candidatus Bathyarchaeia archaeon]|nr:DUF1285 domain-containing protein [Candidatus Bathyarchaeia archaeon]
MTGAPASDPSTWTMPRLRIDRDGTWFHDDAEVTHAGILTNLRGGLQVDAHGHYLQIGPARVPVEVEDAPFVVDRVELDDDELVATLNDGSREPLAVATLRLDERSIPRCRVKGGRFEARLSRAATYQLLQHVEPPAGDRPAALVIGGRRLRVPGL